jgi:hypothetical protein
MSEIRSWPTLICDTCNRKSDNQHVDENGNICRHCGGMVLLVPLYDERNALRYADEQLGLKSILDEVLDAISAECWPVLWEQVVNARVKLKEDAGDE